MIPLLLSLLCISSLQLPCVKSEDGNITFIFMLSRPSRQRDFLLEENTAGVQPAVDMALDYINDRESLLSDYSLSYGEAAVNSQCDSRVSLRQFFDEIRSSPIKYFLLGAGCSLATENVGEIANFWEIITMSYASQSSVLNQRSLYRNVFRTVPSSLGIADIVVALFAEYNWNKIVTVTQQESEFEAIASAIYGSSMMAEQLYFQSDEDVANTVSFGTSSNTRIYLLNMYPPHARRVLCAAYRNDPNIKYPRYVWLVYGWYPANWWTESVSGYDPMVTCTDEQLQSLLERSLILSNYPLTYETDSTPTDVGLTRSQFFAMYRNLTASYNYSESYAAPFAYDALWAVALAINSSIPSLSYNLSQFDHKSIGRSITSDIANTLYNISFTGVTGTVSFNSNGTRRESEPRVSQYRLTNGELSPVLIARINVSLNASGGLAYTWVYLNNENSGSVWSDGVPSDGTPEISIVGILVYVYVPVYILGVSTIITGIIFAIVNFIFRSRKIIRLTSPNLNYLIVLGCILMSASGLIYSFPTTNYTAVYVLCYIRAYTQLVGYSLCFGTICAKMWRVYFIFHNPTPKKRKAIKDWHLFAVVLVLCIIDLVLMSTALGADRQYVPILVDDKERSNTDTNEYGIVYEYKNRVCDSPRSIIWIAIVFLKMFLVQSAAVFFAIKTRRVKIKVLNDAKWISIIIYVTSFVLAVTLSGALALANFLNADAAVFSTGLIVVSFLVLCILFIPKWYSLYKDPQGEKIFEKGSQPSFMSAGNNLTAVDHENMVHHIEQLEKRLGKYEAVTPYQTRKRVLSSGSALDTNNPRLAALKIGNNSREGRSLSYSPGLDVTASLPVSRLGLARSPAPPSPNNINNSGDSGVNDSSKENSEDKPRPAGNGNMFTLREEAEESNESNKDLKELNDYKTESQRVLTFEDELHESPF
ncbi:PREDICTED: gamma-aminobutyric acid type B receptor subunit 2-like [Amphimedon queenslandica]|uniref:G-protein coupled receptors family 3 profile domain-containing protein n=1 Tax=Amphimedon queenslandica TaxID=400682 RepID=A0A1X7VGR5_AMPQE|nr:PREDICTED: gamma-aminobutyric acid type B receptor subunit 2-like [Amphimedon queenslandica]|eukprot:XP_003384356.1 PREDICTED: gamma-aminobutyric acid type B receptor subunit 2-like [Amphimedon queenslandica]